MADGSLLPPNKEEQPAITPVVVSSPPRFARRGLLRSPAALVITALTFLTAWSWFFQTFVGVRGVTQLAFSRWLLVGMWVCSFGMVVVLTIHLRRKALVRSVGGIVLLGFSFWLDAWAPKPPVPVAAAPGHHLSLEEQNEILTGLTKLSTAKAQLLESPEYQKINDSKRRTVALILRLEKKYNCVFEDLSSGKCFGGTPPSSIPGSNLAINVLQAFVSGSPDDIRFWLLHQRLEFRSPAPVALKLRFSNNEAAAIKVDRSALEYLSPKGWQQIRRVGTLDVDSPFGSGDIVFERHPYLASGYFVAGGNLFPRIYEDQIAPRHSIEGWVLAEMPDRVNGADALTIRISAAANGKWVARSSTEPQSPTSGQEPQFDESKSAQVIDGFIVER